MNILIACEFSGIVRDAFIKKGHNAISCDIIQSESKGPHIQGDVLLLLRYKWDLIVAHPPCTYLCNSGVRWLYDSDGSKNEDRFHSMMQGVIFFMEFFKTDSKLCVENPIMHKYAKYYTGKQTQIIQPWQYGHGESKATCLWLRGLPDLVPTDIVAGRVPRIHMMSPSGSRSKNRSRTYKGVADAMAEQWGS